MIDALGHPITVGCTVLTPGYWSPTMSKIMKVGRVTKTRIILTMEGIRHLWSDKAKTWEPVTELREVRRQPHQVLVVDKQLKHNRKNFPEHII